MNNQMNFSFASNHRRVNSRLDFVRTIFEVLQAYLQYHEMNDFFCRIIFDEIDHSPSPHLFEIRMIRQVTETSFLSELQSIQQNFAFVNVQTKIILVGHGMFSRRASPEIHIQIRYGNGSRQQTSLSMAIPSDFEFQRPSTICCAGMIISSYILEITLVS